MPGFITFMTEDDDNCRLHFHCDQEPLLRGPLRQSRDHALKDAEELRHAASEDGRYQLERNTGGGFSFRIVGPFGDTLGSSAPHPDPGSLGLTIARIKALMPDAEIILP